MQKKSRIGVYGLVIRQGKILLIEQPKGPYMGLFDFPGGGLEFGETIEQALRREFQEELNMGFESMSLLENLTATVEVTGEDENSSYLFYQIGLVYAITNVQPLSDATSSQNLLKSEWVEPKHLSPLNCSPFVWKILEAFSVGGGGGKSAS